MKDSEINQTTAFQADQFDAIYPPGIENHYWNRSRNRIIEKIIRSTCHKNKQIVEIGCGRGIVVKYLIKQGYYISGCDLADFNVDDSVMGILFPETDFAELPESILNSTETILLLDVIEHLEVPSEFLRKIADTFPRLQNIIITVPACPELWSNYDEFNGHFRRYSMNDLKNIDLPKDFKITKCRYLFRLLYIPAMVQVRLFKQRNTELKAPAGIGNIVHRLISAILLFDFYFFPSGWKGTSLAAVLSKKQVTAK